MTEATDKDGAQIVILLPVLFAIQLVLAEVVNWLWPLGFGSSSEMRLAFGLGTIANQSMRNAKPVRTSGDSRSCIVFATISTRNCRTFTRRCSQLTVRLNLPTSIVA